MTALTPKLRFPEFSDKWKNFKLEQKCNHISYGLTVRPEYLESGIPLISAREIVNGIVDIENAPKISENDFEKLSEKAKPQKGDIFLTKTGTIGLTAQYSSNIKIAITQNIAVLRISDLRIDNPNFLLQFLRTSLFKKKTISLVNQSTIMDLQLGDIRNIILMFPTFPEQTKIANFLTAVDEKIQALKEKKRLLENYKKGLMQKIFSQEIRFKQDDGSDFPDWEEKSFKDLFTIGSGRDYKHLNKGNIPVFGTGGYMTSVDEFLYDGETVCIGRKGTIDKPMFFDGEIWTVDTLFYTHSFQKVLPRFIFYVFNTINWKEYNEASGVPSLSKSTIEKILTFVPTLSEQQKIAKFLTSIDEKIEKVGHQIEEAQTFKKGLLQKMFV